MKFTLAADLTDEVRQSILDDFIKKPIESQRLQFGGGGSENWVGVVEPTSPERSIPSALVSRIRDWLVEAPDVVDYELSEPWDVCHGNNPFD